MKTSKTNAKANDLKPKGTSPSVFIKFTLLNLILLAVEFGDRNSVLVSARDEPENEAAIELTSFQVPAQVRVNDIRRLSCQFKLHGATLHALKLFKDDQEFYRLSRNNHKMSFTVPGVYVYLNRSSKGDVWVKMSRLSGGLYKCQVLIEDTFKSVSMAKRIEVEEATAAAPSTRAHARPTGGEGHTNRSGGPWQQSPVQQRHLYSFGVGNSGHAHLNKTPPPAAWWWLLPLASLSAAISLIQGTTAIRLAALSSSGGGGGGGRRRREEIERWRRKSPQPSTK